MTDPIVDEVRRIRDEYAARFNYDLDLMFLDIKKREKESGLIFVDGVARQPMPSQSLPAEPNIVVSGSSEVTQVGQL